MIISLILNPQSVCLFLIAVSAQPSATLRSFFASFLPSAALRPATCSLRTHGAMAEEREFDSDLVIGGWVLLCIIDLNANLSLFSVPEYYYRINFAVRLLLAMLYLTNW